ncbi:MAG: hypothetical protein II886_11400 [Prevotella sp.]|nr:hypothetical protein [Prevotella sp.]
MKQTVVISLLALALTVSAADYDQNKPFGFCTVASRSNAACTYQVTGGGCCAYPLPEGFAGKVAVLTSEGADVDMEKTIERAIRHHDVIILDGSKGDFFVAGKVDITLDNKTLLGINHARLCTRWHMTPAMKRTLDEAGVPSMSTSGGGGILPNGARVREEAEYNTRKILIQMTGDSTELFRNAGVLSLRKCSNIIVRNITFVGPGSVDVGGSDLLTCSGSTNCWIDHCAFQDGMDGNFDINNQADFITVSWCTFSYTERSYMHQNTNLVGYSDREKVGFLNTTFAFNWWGEGCKQRMPMARVGKIHMLNNYYTSTTASNCINPRKNSEFLIEGNYFDKGVKRYYSQDGAIAVTWTADNHISEAATLPSSIGDAVTVPYDYTVAPCSAVPEVVKAKAGATLFGN